MAFYIVIATLIFFGIFLKDTKHMYLKFVFVLLFLFTALHNPKMGSDPINYMRIFGIVHNLNAFISDLYLFTDYGIGVPLLMSITKTIHNDYFLFQVFYSLLSTILLYKVIIKAGLENRDLFLTLFVYFCYRYFQNSMEFLRQGIAIELVWLAFLSLNDHEKLKIEPFVIASVGSLFHASAIIAVLVLPLLRIVSKREFRAKDIFWLTASISIFMMVVPIYLYSSLLYWVLKGVGSSFVRYADHVGVDSGGLNYINFAIRLAFLFIVTFNFENIDYNKKRSIFVLGCLAVLVGSINMSYITRLLEYFMIAIYIVTAISYKSFSRNSKYAYLFCIYGAFMIILIRNLHTVGGGGYLNWQMYFGG